MKAPLPRWLLHVLFWASYFVLMSIMDGFYDDRYGRSAAGLALTMPLRVAMVYWVFWRMDLHAKAHWRSWALETIAILVACTFAYRLLMQYVIYPWCYQEDYTFEFWNAYRFGYMLRSLAFVLFSAIALRLLKRMFTEPAMPPAPAVSTDDTNPDALFFKVNKQQIRVMLSEIIYIESMKEYSKIHLKHRSWVTQMTLTEMEQRLPAHQFVRIHRSYIVNRGKITAYSASEVVLDQLSLPIGKTYKGVGLVLT
jgi:hypothetical protein